MACTVPKSVPNSLAWHLKLSKLDPNPSLSLGSAQPRCWANSTACPVRPTAGLSLLPLPTWETCAPPNLHFTRSARLSLSSAFYGKLQTFFGSAPVPTTLQSTGGLISALSPRHARVEALPLQSSP